MFLSASLAIALLAARDPTQLELEKKKASITVAWLDTEDRVQGTITPAEPVVGRPLTVSVHVGSFEGEAFDGPVTITLKPARQIGRGESATVARAPGEKVWVARFTPQEPGEHVLELSFRTTHLKVVRGTVLVAEPKVPPWLALAVGGGLIATALALGLWALFRTPADRAASSPQAPPQTPPPPPQAPP